MSRPSCTPSRTPNAPRSRTPSPPGRLSVPGARPTPSRSASVVRVAPSGVPGPGPRAGRDLGPQCLGGAAGSRTARTRPGCWPRAGCSGSPTAVTYGRGGRGRRKVAQAWRPAKGTYPAPTLVEIRRRAEEPARRVTRRRRCDYHHLRARDRPCGQGGPTSGQRNRMVGTGGGAAGACGQSRWRFRATLRPTWPGYLAVALLVGLLGGLSMGAVAGARRSSPHSRLRGQHQSLKTCRSRRSPPARTSGSRRASTVPRPDPLRRRSAVVIGFDHLPRRSGGSPKDAVPGRGAAGVRGEPERGVRGGRPGHAAAGPVCKSRR